MCKTEEFLIYHSLVLYLRIHGLKVDNSLSNSQVMLVVFTDITSEIFTDYVITISKHLVY